jgi:putative aminopeptidase FrvX
MGGIDTLDLGSVTKKLIDAHGVTGNEMAASRVAFELLEPLVDKAEIDWMGNVIGYKFSQKKGAKKLLFDAHIDQIGFLVTGFSPDGFVKFHALGPGEDVLPGSEVTVLTENGPLTGVVGWVPKTPAQTGQEEMPKLRDMFIDLGFSEEEARSKVQVGDCVSFGRDAVDLLGDAIAGKSTDDRVCFVSILRALELLKDTPLNVDVIAVGARARGYADAPDYVIALDVSGAAPLGKGPIIAIGSDSNLKFAERLMEVARAKEIRYVPRSIPTVSGTNAKHYQVAGTGAVTCVVSFPQKYMHTPTEIVRTRDIEAVAKLLAEFAASFDGSLQGGEPHERQTHR